jgi:low temperature requirement protein LtrA
MSEAQGLLRGEPTEGHHRVTYVELFFDLVFVFAVTQLSHTLVEHFDALTMLRTGILMVAVWWVWIDTSWATNWLDPDRPQVRAVLFGMMLAGLALSTSIPDAFGQRAPAFGVSYALMQIGRSAFVVAAIPGSETALRMNFRRILAWHCAAGLLWIMGGFIDGNARLWVWGVATALQCVAPILKFWVPGLGASAVSDWKVEGGHMAERCGLFIIIALGESILVTGATFGRTEWSGWTVTAFVSSFVASLAMWWIYFDLGAEAGSRELADSDDPGRLARLAYTYLHLPIVAGVIITAVGDEFVLAHPNGDGEGKTLATVVGGPLVFLAGTLLFKRAVRGWLQLSHLTGIAVLVALLVAAPLTLRLSPAALSLLATLVLIVVAAWESRSLAPRGTGTSAKHDR